MMRTECDNCRVLGDCPPPPGWIPVSVVEEPSPEPTLISAMTGHSPTTTDTEGIFCSWKCVAEYASVKALVGEEATEPQEDQQ